MTAAAPLWTLHGQAAAKLNLALEITGTTPDGYHTLRSVMIGLALSDLLTIEGRGPLGPHPAIHLCVRGGGDDVPDDERNLVARAIRAFIEEAPDGWPAELSVRLDKRIPSQAGMGGGSADAGAVLRLLAQVRPLEQTRLLEVAARLGSDVPFMVNGGAALAEGRGDRLHALTAPRSWWVVLVQPTERISTPWAYQQFDLRASRTGPPPPSDRVDALAAALEAGDLAGVASNLYNDLQAAVCELYPHLEDIPRVLVAAGCEGALMTGSGSVFFGLAASRASARIAARAARERRLGRVWVTRTWREAR